MKEEKKPILEHGGSALLVSRLPVQGSGLLLQQRICPSKSMEPSEEDSQKATTSPSFPRETCIPAASRPVNRSDWTLTLRLLTQHVIFQQENKRFFSVSVGTRGQLMSRTYLCQRSSPLLQRPRRAARHLTAIGHWWRGRRWSRGWGGGAG